MSLVERDPSVVMRLNEASTACVRAVWSAPGSTTASVVITASMVAMAGESIAAPLAMPPTVMVTPPTSKVAIASLATVSVVMMASAAERPASGVAARAAAAAGTPVVNGSIGMGIPIRPVEQTRTWLRSQPRASATSAAVPSATSRPGSPVAALALPELRTTAAACDPPARCRRLSWTGAAATRLVVNTPAAVTGRWSAVATSDRSGRPDALMPAATPAATKPWAAVTDIRAPARRRGGRGSRGGRGGGWRSGAPGRRRPSPGCPRRRWPGPCSCGRRSGR